MESSFMMFGLKMILTRVAGGPFGRSLFLMMTEQAAEKQSDVLFTRLEHDKTKNQNA